MHPFSTELDCFTDISTGNIWEDFSNNLKYLTSFQDGPRFPIILSIRKADVALHFTRYFEEEAEATSSTFRAVNAAYQPNEILLSYLTESESLTKMIGCKPPILLSIHVNVNKTSTNIIVNSFSIIFSKAKLDETGSYDFLKIVTKSECQSSEEFSMLDFAFKDVVLGYLDLDLDRQNEAKSGLENWRPSVNWSFDLVENNLLPEESLKKE